MSSGAGAHLSAVAEDDVCINSNCRPARQPADCVAIASTDGTILYMVGMALRIHHI
ncbi:MAG: hypothetical protein ACUZ8N_03170 [Candidatus Scalindua sp.]